MEMSELDDPDLAWVGIDQQLVFLDIAGDRYFSPSPARSRALVAELAKSGREPWQQPLSLARPCDWVPATQSSLPARDTGLHLAEIAQALWVQRRVERRLSSGDLASVLAGLRAAVERRTVESEGLSRAGEAVVHGFEQARLLRTAADRCLARSIALALCLAAKGDRARIVLGVRIAPFGAHCWAQHGDKVLNDSLEEVQRYHPILVV